MTTFAIHTPTTRTDAVELSARTYRKQVLPKGTIDYKGRKITFDDAYLTQLATSFVDKAFDQVGFMLAPDDNSHTLDPERFRGEIKALETAPDGLYAIVEFASDEAAKAVLDNPKLGVSARIVEQYDRADGKHYPRAIQHVLGTLDPRVTGMKPWEAISLSNNELTVVDLSDLPYEKKEAPMPEDTITAEQRKAFDLYLTELAAMAPAGAAGDARAAGGDAGAADAALDAEIQALLGDAEAGSDALVGAGAGGAELSAETRAAIDLANSRAEQAVNENAAIRDELDAANFEREKAVMLSAGVPPAVIELAMPLLIGKEHVIELSNSKKVDAGEVVRALLKEFEGTVDLSGETVPAVGSPAGDKTGAMLDQWEKEHPAMAK